MILILRYSIPFEKINKKKVLLQFPEGMIQYIDRISEEFKQKGYDVVISADPCFGACDLKFFEDRITVHFGHYEFYKAENVIYVPVLEEFDEKWLLNEINIIEYDVLYTTDQFYERLKEIGLNPVKSVGCRLFKKGEKPLFVGTGVFHPRGISYLLGKDVICLDPVSKKTSVIKYEFLYTEKEIRKFKFLKCNKIGIIVSTKPGQCRMDQVKLIEEKCEERNMKYDILTMENIDQRIDYFPYDGYIITACPRIVIDDWKNYKKPIILPDEFNEIQY